MIVSVNQNIDNTNVTDKYKQIFARAYQALEKYGIENNANYLRITHEHKSFHSLDEYFAHLEWLYLIDKTFIMLPLDETPFVIDANKRTITNPKITIMQGDQNAEVVMFTIDRYFDYKDLDTANIYVQWTLPDGKEGASPIEMKDLSIPGKIRFGWPLDNEITSQKGTVRFSVRFWNKDMIKDEFGQEQQDQIVYSLNTMTSSLTINESLQPEIKDDNINAPIANGFFKKAIRNSQMYYQNAAAPMVPNFGEPGTNLNMYESLSVVDGKDTLTLMAQAVTGDTGVVSYEWQYKPARDVEIDGVKYFSNTWYPFNAIEGEGDEAKPGFSAFGGFVSDDVYVEIALADDEAPVIGEVYYMDDAEGNKVAYDYSLPRPTLYERYTTYTVPEGDVAVTGEYKVIAKNTIMDNTSMGCDSQICNLVSPENIVLLTNGDLPEKYIMEGEDDKLVIKVKADSNIFAKRTYEWSRKTTNENAEDADEVQITESNEFELTEPGWYEVTVRSVLNREEKDLKSKVCKVTNHVVAPARAIEVVEGEEDPVQPMFAMSYGAVENGLGGYLDDNITPRFDGPLGSEYELNIVLTENLPDNIDRKLLTENLTYEWALQVQDESMQYLTEVHPAVVSGIGTDKLKVRVIENDVKYTYKCFVTNHLNGEKATCELPLAFAVM